MILVDSNIEAFVAQDPAIPSDELVAYALVHLEAGVEGPAAQP